MYIIRRSFLLPTAILFLLIVCVPESFCDTIFQIEEGLKENFQLISRSVVEIVVDNSASSEVIAQKKPPRTRSRRKDPNEEACGLACSKGRMGTGFAIDEDKNILTAEELVRGIENGGALGLICGSGIKIPAVVVGADPISGVAVIRAKPADRSQQEALDKIEPATLGDTADLSQGSFLLMISNAYDMRNSAFWGLLSGRQKQLDCYLMHDYLQTTLPLHPGAVGAPVCNIRGEVVGIMATAFRHYPWQEISFATPVERFREILPILIDEGCVPRGYLGVRISNLVQSNKEELSIPEDTDGILVVEILPGSPAFNAGIQVGDVIQGIGGERVRDVQEVLWKIANARPGTAANIAVLRKGEQSTFEVILGDSCKDSPLSKE